MTAKQRGERPIRSPGHRSTGTRLKGRSERADTSTGGKTKGERRKVVLKRKPNESGAALVEFALLVPIFMALVLGMFSGGVIYNQKLDLSHATREGARYGAAVSKDQVFANGNSWASNVRDLVVNRSAGDLVAGGGTTAGISSDGVCVALVTGSPATVYSQASHDSSWYSTSGSAS